MVPLNQHFVYLHKNIIVIKLSVESKNENFTKRNIFLWYLGVMHDFIHVLLIVVNVNVVIPVIYDQKRNLNKYLFFFVFAYMQTKTSDGITEEE